MKQEKCETCKKNVNENEMIVYNGLNYYFCSKACYTSFLSKRKEKEDYDFLYDEICRIFGISKLNGKLLSQIKNLKENYNLSYKNIFSILHYMYDIQQMPIYSPTLYYVQENIEDAKKYYQSLKEREIRTAKAIAEIKELPTKIVRPNYSNNRRNRLKIDPNTV